jgi:hypothetical protein
VTTVLKLAFVIQKELPRLMDKKVSFFHNYQLGCSTHHFFST